MSRREATARAREPARPAGGDVIAAHFTRSAILGAAAKVFSRAGIAATRVEDILVAAGIARRTFYKYFASKEEVLAALYEVWTAELLSAIEGVRARQPAQPLAALRAGIDIFLGFYRASPRPLRELIELAQRSDSLLAPRRRWLRDQLVRVLDESIRALDGRRLDPYVFHALVSALEGLTLELGAQCATAADIERARAVIHALADHALGLPRPARLPGRR